MSVHSIYLIFLFMEIFAGNEITWKSVHGICPGYKKTSNINVADLVGSWMSVYIHPAPVNCFVFHIRATTDLERDQNVVKYGTFDGSVDWSQCFLEVETPVGKHFLQGNGSLSGLMRNIIIFWQKLGHYELQSASADQWTIFGRRGSELLICRDCAGETAAAFTRAPYWPNFNELNAILHRSGIAIQSSKKHSMCKPKDICSMDWDLRPHGTGIGTKGDGGYRSA